MGRPRRGARPCPKTLREQQALNVTTIRRAELTEHQTSMTAAKAVRDAGFEFIYENGGGCIDSDFSFLL